MLLRKKYMRLRRGGSERTAGTMSRCPTHPPRFMQEDKEPLLHRGPSARLRGLNATIHVSLSVSRQS